jgi:hypothetical protein
MQRVYVVESPRMPAYPMTVIEAIALGCCVGGHFVRRHQDVSLWAISAGVSALAGYLTLHALKATAWITLIAGVVVWGGLGFGVAHSAWPESWLVEGICASVGGLLSMAEKARIYGLSQNAP